MSFLRHKNEATGRISFQKIPPVMELPYLIELQCSSYDRFLKKGMDDTFKDISPIEDFTGNLVLEFLEHKLDEPPQSVEKCRDKDATYAYPLKVKVRLTTKENGEVREAREQEIFIGDFPAMTDRGTFIINGAERVIVSQLVRSPGIYYQHHEDPDTGRSTWSAVVIPNRGAWMEFETDTSGVIYVRIDKARKLPATVLLRALEYESNDDIRALFNYEPLLEKTLEKDTVESVEDALLEIYKKQRPGEQPSQESARTLLNNLFFERKRYDLARVGSYRLARKLGQKIVCTNCGAYNMPDKEECCECGQHLEYPSILRKDDVVAVVRYVLALMKADAYRRQEEGSKKDDKSASISLNEGLPLYLENGVFKLKACGEGSFDVLVKHDDIDHLGNRRIRGVGELLQNQFRVGLLRLERVVRERMSVQDIETITPQLLINTRPVTAAIKEFFGSSQLSQFMDQTNMLAELTHKRRLSALGPGGLSRERAGFEVRDVHDSHYGRICPIETPEGPNIGLIGSLATYGRVNSFGFIEAPYRKVDLILSRDVVHPVTGTVFHSGEVLERKDYDDLVAHDIKPSVRVHVTDNIQYQDADVEDEFVICQANTRLDERSNIIDDRVVVRRKRGKKETTVVSREEVDFMDVTPKQIVSVATALIPFLEHDDANRALMGANMQRQAVPLLSPQAPIVGTGMEYRAATDSGALVVSKHKGYVSAVCATSVTVTDEQGQEHVYPLRKFKRSNAGTCINQRPAVNLGQRVDVRSVLADGASSVNGELALGRNVLVAFMPWEGYNYEDAILLSEEVARDDVFTSIHIEEHECEARDTKLGAEEITRDIPSVGEDALKDLDEDGIVRIGAEVNTEDILVGKVTPKGETELTAEERLLRAIFGEKARDVRDTSLKVPHGQKGKVIDVKVFNREDEEGSGKKNELKPGVNKLVRVYVAQKRKIMQGDKMAGRHGNKGVVSRVMPIEDMPYLPDGTPVQIVLNPLGVPSRMNIGQILETHLGLAMAMLSEPGQPRFRVEVPVFDSASEQELRYVMNTANLQADLQRKGVYLNTEELVYVLDEPSLISRLQEFIKNKTKLIYTTQELKKIVDETPANQLASAISKELVGYGVDINEINQVLRERSLEDRLGEVLIGHRKHYSLEQIREIATYIELYRRHVVVDGKTVLYDGRTGEPYDGRVTVGQIYMLKLAHLVDDKIHARSTGPYSLITQQPLGGKAQFGGQRFGEMEVWALEAYGAAYTLQELLTVKSDDVLGRVKTYEAIVKGENVLEPGVPESFKVLIKELQSLALDVKILNSEGREIDMLSMEDQEPVHSSMAHEMFELPNNDLAAKL
ncbi:MAG: DNA-directed RNA polymerase subunit beta [Candidatus Bruticola sp.]